MDYQQIKIESVKLGDFFRLKPDAKKTYIIRKFNQSIKRFYGQNYDDISDYKSIKKGTTVFINFTF